VGVAALRRITESKEIAFVAARKGLQAKRAGRWKPQGLPGQIRRRWVAWWGLFGFEQAIAAHQFGDARRRGDSTGGGNWRGGYRSDWPMDGLARIRGGFLIKERKIQQALAIVGRGPQDLTARYLFEGGRDSALDPHPAGIDWQTIGQPGQGGSVGTQQKRGFHQIACGLLDRERSELGVIERALGHYTGYRSMQLLLNLRDRQFGKCPITAPARADPLISGIDCALSTLDGDIHGVLTF
jgi:hypothetical protein